MLITFFVTITLLLMDSEFKPRNNKINPEQTLRLFLKQKEKKSSRPTKKSELDSSTLNKISCIFNAEAKRRFAPSAIQQKQKKSKDDVGKKNYFD